MSAEQINTIRQSFQKVAAQEDVAADVFYNRLFEIKPIFRAMFPTDLREQKQKLMKMLAIAIASLDRFTELKPVLEQLGRNHANYGVRDDYYAPVGGALLWTLSELLGAESFTTETGAAWAEMLERVSATMIHAAHEFADETKIQSRIETAKLPNHIAQPLAV